jgi:pyruvate dehydrogenase E2 component (dihydrolipoamide acetyltransferase)
MIRIEMPQLGETVSEGTIIKWFKAVGDIVAENEALFEVSTDKVDSEVPSPVSGVVREIRVPQGETVEVGTVLAIVAPDGHEMDEPSIRLKVAQDMDELAQHTSPPLHKSADILAISILPEVKTTDNSHDGEGGGSRLTSPILHRLIKSHGIDADSIAGTGAASRITRSDVERLITAEPNLGTSDAESDKEATHLDPVTSKKEISGRGGVIPTQPAQYPGSVVPLNKIRRLTGEHMVQSKAISPHVLTAVEVDYERIEMVRHVHRDQWKKAEGFSLTYLPFICRALVDTLMKFPLLNASVGDGELLVHSNVNLSIAVDLNHHGLLAPTIHRAEEMRLRGIAREISSLADRARSKHLQPDNLVGGTFTVSNSGAFGTFMVVPVINQPQVAILSTDGVSRRPVVVTDERGGESIAIHSIGMLALSWDHRAFDGAYAALFMRELKEHLEAHDWESEL